METIYKLDFAIDLEEGQMVKDIELDILTNGKQNTNYSYDDFEVYLYNDNLKVCGLEEQKPLNKDYVLKSNETYVINIKELTFKNMNYSPVIWQSANTVFINNNDIDDYVDYCFGTHKNEGEYESFAFVYSTAKENINEEENQTTQQVECPNVSDVNFFRSNSYITLLYGIIFCLIIIIAFLVFKHKKNN